MRATIFILAAFLCGAAHCTDGSEMITEVKGKLTTVIDSFVANLSDVTKVLDPVKELLSQAIHLLDTLVDKIKSALGGYEKIWNSLPIKSTLGALEKSLTVLVSLLESTISGLLSGVASLLKNLLSTVFSILDKIADKLQVSRSTCSDAISKTLLSLITTLDQELGKCITDLKDALLAVVSLVTGPLSKLTSGFQSAIDSTPSCKLHQILTCLVPVLGSVVFNILTSLTSVVTSLFTIFGKLSDVSSAVTTCTSIQATVLTTGVTGALSTLVTCVSG